MTIHLRLGPSGPIYNGLGPPGNQGPVGASGPNGARGAPGADGPRGVNVPFGSMISTASHNLTAPESSNGRIDLSSLLGRSVTVPVGQEYKLWVWFTPVVSPTSGNRTGVRAAVQVGSQLVYQDGVFSWDADVALIVGGLFNLQPGVNSVEVYLDPLGGTSGVMTVSYAPISYQVTI